MTFPILISNKEIQEIVKHIAKQIKQDYSLLNELNFIVVLKGAKPFADDLIKQLSQEYKINTYFIEVSSYGSNKVSCGKISLKQDIVNSIEEKDVIIIEDLIDTGYTLEFLKEYFLNQKKVKSVKICCLISKSEKLKSNVKVDYVGKEIPDKFIVGYGMDYAEKYRELKDIHILD